MTPPSHLEKDNKKLITITSSPPNPPRSSHLQESRYRLSELVAVRKIALSENKKKPKPNNPASSDPSSFLGKGPS
jgi:hypothetical protein